MDNLRLFSSEDARIIGAGSLPSVKLASTVTSFICAQFVVQAMSIF